MILLRSSCRWDRIGRIVAWMRHHWNDLDRVGLRENLERVQVRSDHCCSGAREHLVEVRARKQVLRLRGIRCGVSRGFMGSEEQQQSMGKS
jgi:hypothetical protein